MTDFTIKQTGNKVEVHGGDLAITYEVFGMDLPEMADVSFAIWHLVPQAMVSRSSIHIKGVVDPLVIRNAKRLSRIWEMWAPTRFREVKISADEMLSPSRQARGRDIVFFSGGVDSTFYLLNRGQRPRGGHVLTIHGMDYKFEDSDRFSELIDKTTPLLRNLNYKRVIIRTNAASYSQGARLTHGFTLSGCAFLLGDLFDEAILAADYTWEQDMVSFPWGTNHVTNRHLSGTDFKIETGSMEWTRTEKVEAIAKNHIACDSISFCVNYDMRPHNCGKCSKCIRTKAMFIASTGSVPAIFKDASLVEADLQGIDLPDRNEYAHFADLFLHARARGNLHKLPGLEKAMTEFREKIAPTAPG